MSTTTAATASLLVGQVRSMAVGLLRSIGMNQAQVWGVVFTGGAALGFSIFGA